MNEFVGAITNITNIVLWFAAGVPCALLLNYLGEKHFHQGSSWALAGLLFNVFAVLGFLMIIGYQASESSSAGTIEKQRMQRMLRATRGEFNLNRRIENIEDGSHLSARPIDEKIEALLAQHQPAAALEYAKERYRVAFQTGDSTREALYNSYITSIEDEDRQRRERLDNLRGPQA